ncbi:unnamed protein product [Adineta ricciae]|uniref:Uncharacterized protein n=1 Tax=Adineta ricciae TaxID=249248 RepID=A0A814UXU7_ADIRI|nr:unnamed protein product [Adineta ricciae]CAF1179298.1 unnamed protein product [Adineta ricciae]
MDSTLEKLASFTIYNKPIETQDSNPSIDPTIFRELENQLPILIANDDDFISLLFFLLEHIPLEIDFNVLTSTETNFHSLWFYTRKMYKLNLNSKLQNRYDHCSQSQTVLQHIFQNAQVKTLEELLRTKQNIQQIFNRLTPFLLKTTYTQYPVAIELFMQIVKCLDQPTLTESFDLIFSVCLITLDDPSVDMKLVSLYLLDHLQKHCTSTELLLFNRANVIMYGLEQNLHRRNDPMPFFECLLATTYRWIIILENKTYSGKHLFIRTSQLIEKLIRDAILETNIEYRRCLLRILKFYIIRLQLFAIRHLNHFLELLDDSIDNRSLRNQSLENLVTILETLEPRINVHRLDIMKIIVRCLFRIFHDEQNNHSQIMLVKTCLGGLQSSTTDNYVQDALQSLIKTTDLDLSYREFLRQFM